MQLVHPTPLTLLCLQTWYPKPPTTIPETRTTSVSWESQSISINEVRTVHLNLGFTALPPWGSNILQLESILCTIPLIMSPPHSLCPSLVIHSLVKSTAIVPSGHADTPPMLPGLIQCVLNPPPPFHPQPLPISRPSAHSARQFQPARVSLQSPQQKSQIHSCTCGGRGTERQHRKHDQREHASSIIRLDSKVESLRCPQGGWLLRARFIGGNWRHAGSWWESLCFAAFGRCCRRCECSPNARRFESWPRDGVLVSAEAGSAEKISLAARRRKVKPSGRGGSWSNRDYVIVTWSATAGRGLKEGRDVGRQKCSEGLEAAQIGAHC